MLSVALWGDAGREGRAGICSFVFFLSLSCLFPFCFVNLVCSLHVFDAGTGQLHRRVLELDLGAPEIIGAGAKGGQRANGCDLDRRLICRTIPVVLGHSLGLRRG